MSRWERRGTNTADYVVVVGEMGFAFSAAEYFVGVEVDVVCEAHFVLSFPSRGMLTGLEVSSAQILESFSN